MPRSHAFSGRWLNVATVIGLFLLPLFAFGAPALLRSVFYAFDVQHYFYPYHVLAANLLKQGEAPLWNPYAFSGIPLLGDGQTALFYPPNWLFFFLPAAAALNYVMLLQFGIAGTGTFLFARTLEMKRLPALVAALAYMFCGFMSTRIVHLSIISGAALMPWLFFCVERSLRTDSARWFLASAFVAALQVFAGHPQVPIYTALGLGLYVLVRAVERGMNNAGWKWIVLLPLRLAGIYLLGFSLAAIQLLPWIEFGALSPRAAGVSFDFIFGSSLSGSEWLLFLFPFLYGSVEPSIYAAHSMSNALAVKTWEHSAYVGILPLALSLVAGRGVASRRDAVKLGGHDGAGGHDSRALHVFLLMLLAIGLVLAVGKYTPLAKLIFAMPFVGSLRNVERALILAAFSLSLLAGSGLQRLTEPDTHHRSAKAAMFLIALLPMGTVLAIAFMSYYGITPPDLLNMRWNKPNVYVPLLLAFASAALLDWWSRRPAGLRTQVLAAALVAVDLCSYAVIFTPTTDPQIYSYQPETVEFLRKDSSLFRKATYIESNDIPNRTAQETLAVSWGIPFSIADINGFNSLQTRRYTDYLFSPCVGDVSYGVLMDSALFHSDSPILSSLNVKYLLIPANKRPKLGTNFKQVYTNREVRVYQNANVYPRAYFVEQARSERDPRVILSTVTAPGFDGRRQALVEAEMPDFPAPSGDAQVDIVRYESNHVVLTTTTSQRRFLVLSEMHFPGWRAYLDGVETSIFCTNYLFRGITVPPGQHTFQFIYRPLSVFIGMSISALALLTMIGIVIIEYRARHR